MTSICGMQSLKFENAPYLKGWASVAGKKEGEGPLGNLIDQIIEDPYFGQESWELAEGRFMKQAAMLAISKADLHKKDIRYAFAGDLLEQNTATFSGMKELGIPLFGLFGACSTVGEAMSLAAMSVAGGFAKHSLAIASSHIGSAEKQFRFPLEYGNQRPLSATWTVTGSGGFIVSKEIGPVKIQGITTGKIVDYGMEDPTFVSIPLSLPDGNLPLFLPSKFPFPVFGKESDYSDQAMFQPLPDRCLMLHPKYEKGM